MLAFIMVWATSRSAVPEHLVGNLPEDTPVYLAPASHGLAVSGASSWSSSTSRCPSCCCALARLKLRARGLAGGAPVRAGGAGGRPLLAECLPAVPFSLPGRALSRHHPGHRIGASWARASPGAQDAAPASVGEPEGCGEILAERAHERDRIRSRRLPRPRIRTSVSSTGTWTREPSPAGRSAWRSRHRHRRPFRVAARVSCSIREEKDDRSARPSTSPRSTVSPSVRLQTSPWRLHTRRAQETGIALSFDGLTRRDRAHPIDQTMSLYFARQASAAGGAPPATTPSSRTAASAAAQGVPTDSAPCRHPWLRPRRASCRPRERILTGDRWSSSPPR